MFYKTITVRQRSREIYVPISFVFRTVIQLPKVIGYIHVCIAIFFFLRRPTYDIYETPLADFADPRGAIEKRNENPKHCTETASRT